MNDVLSRAVAYAISRLEHKDVEIGMNDNGFYVTSKKKILPIKAFSLLKSNELRKVSENAIEKTEVLKRRFRHCATRALMILRNYKGHQKRVGRQQVSSMILISAVKRISNDFSILKEARREVLEDLMDIDSAIEIMRSIEEKKRRIEEVHTSLPSPFALNLMLQGRMDVMKIEDKHEFLKRMHNNILAKIGNKKIDFDMQGLYEESITNIKKDPEKENLKKLAWNLKRVPMFAKEELIKMINGSLEIDPRFLEAVEKYRK